MRQYPNVLDTWQHLSAVARVAAQVLFSECEPGDLVEIRHAVFYQRLPAADETSSRDAFARLEAAGMLRCCFKSRGRNARTIYRLGDPVEAFRRRGMGVHDPDPQLLLPFADEDALGSQEDLGGGVLRLVTGDDSADDSADGARSVPATADVAGKESGKSPGLTYKESGRFPGFMGEESGQSPGLNSKEAASLGSRLGSQSAKPITSKEVGSAVSPGTGSVKGRDLDSSQSPLLGAERRQESQSRDLSTVKRQEDYSETGLGPLGGEARTQWERLRATLPKSDWDAYLARCTAESDQDAPGLVLVAPDEFTGDRVRRLLRGTGLLAGVTIRSRTESHRTGSRPPLANHGNDDCGRVWMLRIRQAVQDCGGRGDTALPESAVTEASRYLAQQRMPAKRVDRLLEKLRAARPANPGGYLNAGLAEICAQCGLPWRQPRRPK